MTFRRDVVGRVALIVAAVAIVGWGVARSYGGLRAAARERLRVERAALSADLSLLARVRADPERLRTELTQLEAVRELAIAGGSVGVAGAAAVAYLEDEARAHRVSVARIEPLAAVDRGEGVLAIPVRLEGETDFQGLLEFLDVLEQGPPLVIVDGLRVQSLSQTGGVVPVAFELSATLFALEPETPSEGAAR